ncbi:hypothetical protein WICPIJ_006367 [Wickerhamomyces pijperi]|uniref:Topoisomerase I damage affected protein 2 n=1 Tax=Wickerhamomyces pijperi TaxID=599730 RepID=A0A9P8Q299_WICPI|nr:hypothetical protein WICPIJ_006367 [Wickerhamomyces pijperi]
MSEINPLFTASQIKAVILSQLQSYAVDFSADQLNGSISSILTTFKTDQRYTHYKIILNATLLKLQDSLSDVSVKQTYGSLINDATDGVVNVKISKEEIITEKETDIGDDYVILFQLVYIKA